MNDCIELIFTREEYLLFDDLYYNLSNLKRGSLFELVYNFDCAGIDYVITKSWLNELTNCLFANSFSESFSELTKNTFEISSTITRSLMEVNGWRSIEYSKVTPYFKYDNSKENEFKIFLPFKYLKYINKTLELIKHVDNFDYEECMITFKYMFVKLDDEKIKKCFEMIHKYSNGLKYHSTKIFSLYKEKLGDYLL